MILNLDTVTAKQISYDNTNSGLTSTNVQDAIDEIVGLLGTQCTFTLSGNTLTITPKE